MNTLLGRISALSSKSRFFLALFVVIGLGTLTAIAIKMRGGNEVLPDMRASSEQARAEQVAALTRDADADGLKDWEEHIFRTDPQNPDTDGDATPDGAEIQQNRDPLNPNTSTDQQKQNDFAPIPAAFAADGVSSPTPNITEQFSRSILPDILGPILAGAAPQPNDLTHKVNNFDFLQNPERVWIGAKHYSKAEITINPNNDIRAIIQMFLAISQSVATYARDPSANQAAIVNFIQNPASEEARVSLLAYQNTLDAIIQDVRKISVPQEYAPFILSYLNTLSKIHHSLALIANVENDPISALLAVKVLPQAQEQFSAVVAQTRNESKKIMERKVKEPTGAQ